MIEKKTPFKRMIFVCTNQREGEIGRHGDRGTPEPACGNDERGENCGMKLLESLREEVKKRGLKGKIRVAKSGCMDLCAQGPTIMIFDDQGAYLALTHVTQEDIPAIAEKFLI